MRSMKLQKGVVLLLVLAIATSGMSLSAHQQAAKPDTGKKQQLQQRIERGENGLLPPVVLKGETPARMRIHDIVIIRRGGRDYRCKRIRKMKPFDKMTGLQDMPFSKVKA